MDIPTPSPADTRRPRCPRCGSSMGSLASEERPPAMQAAMECYCGCCGLVVARPVEPAR